MRFGGQAETVHDGNKPAGGVADELLEALHAIHRDVARLEFPFDTEGRAEHEDLRDRVLTRISSQLLPRIADATSPAVVVLGGSTGAGKSTLLNTLVGREITPAGVLRPTTRRAVAAHHPANHAVPLRDLADAVADQAVPKTMVLVDAPDLDSLERDNRAAATRLLEVADLWMVVTTAARYGDRVPWNTLIRAKERGLQIAIVLNRLPKKAKKAVRRDLLRRLELVGLGEAPMFLIEDLSPHEGLLPERTVKELRAWLKAAIGKRQASSIIRRTAAGAWPSLVRKVNELAAAAREQTSAANSLRAQTLADLRRPENDIVYAIEEGACAAGAPTIRWEALTGPSGPLAGGRSLFDASRTPSQKARKSRARALRSLGADITASTITLLADAIFDAAVTIEREWRSAKALPLLPDHQRISAATTRKRAEEALSAWFDDVAHVLDDVPSTKQVTTHVDPDGVTHLLAAAAVRVGDAEEIVGDVLSAEAVEKARKALTLRARDAVRAVALPCLAALQSIADSGLADVLSDHAQTLEGLINEW